MYKGKENRQSWIFNLKDYWEARTEILHPSPPFFANSQDPKIGIFSKNSQEQLEVAHQDCDESEAQMPHQRVLITLATKLKGIYTDG
jgi:hypothetical protein